MLIISCSVADEAVKKRYKSGTPEQKDLLVSNFRKCSSTRYCNGLTINRAPSSDKDSSKDLPLASYYSFWWLGLIRLHPP